MPIELKIQADFSKVLDHLTDAEKKQIPFATSLAINRAAAQTVAAIKGELPDRFTLRNNYVRKGIRLEPSTKRKLCARIYTEFAPMALQEQGGTKEGRALSLSGRGQSIGIRGLAMPLTGVAVPLGARPNKDKPIPREYYLSNVLSMPRTFVGEWNGAWHIWQRLQRRGDNGRSLLRILYTIEPFQHVDPRWEVLKTSEKSVAAHFPRAFQYAWDTRK